MVNMNNALLLLSKSGARHEYSLYNNMAFCKPLNQTDWVRNCSSAWQAQTENMGECEDPDQGIWWWRWWWWWWCGTCDLSPLSLLPRGEKSVQSSQKNNKRVLRMLAITANLSNQMLDMTCSGSTALCLCTSEEKRLSGMMKSGRYVSLLLVENIMKDGKWRDAMRGEKVVEEGKGWCVSQGVCKAACSTSSGSLVSLVMRRWAMGNLPVSLHSVVSSSPQG